MQCGVSKGNWGGVGKGFEAYMCKTLNLNVRTFVTTPAQARRVELSEAVLESVADGYPLLLDQHLGFGRIVALYDHPSTSYQIC